MDWTGLIWGAAGLAAGGVLKGAIGAGAPIIAVPILALLYNVPVAVAIFTFPALLGNIWQAWSYRQHVLSRGFALRFAGAGAAGVFAGSFLLAYLPGDLLMACLAAIVFVYIGIRVARPGWTLPLDLAERLALPLGFLGGTMQGAGGISAPVSVAFLSAMRLERLPFIATISIFFTAMAAVQIPTLFTLGILTPERTALSLLGCLPLFAAMPLGAWLARFISRETFDRLVLVLLVVIALRLLWNVVA